MNWNRSKSVILSKICVVLFSILLIVLDIGCDWLVNSYLEVTHPLGGKWDEICLMALIYFCNIPAWITLWSLWRILNRIWNGEVFVDANVRDMRRTSWCCLGVSVLCALAMPFYLSLSMVAVMAGFMGLIVRIVKNAFEQAVSMKDELDFTV